MKVFTSKPYSWDKGYPEQNLPLNKFQPYLFSPVSVIEKQTCHAIIRIYINRVELVRNITIDEGKRFQLTDFQ